MSVEDLEDIVKILIDMLINTNISKDEIILTLRKYHYCFDCRNHFRNCTCNNKNTSEDSESNDDYTSSEYNEDSEYNESE